MAGVSTLSEQSEVTGADATAAPENDVSREGERDGITAGLTGFLALQVAQQVLKALTEEIALYDRQIRVWGFQTQER